LSTAGRKASLVLLSNVAGTALGYLTLLLIGRYFAPAAYGSYLFALSLTGLVAVISNLGLGLTHQRHIAQGIEAGRALGVLVRMRLAIGSALLVLFAVAYLAWSRTHSSPVTDATTPTVIGIALLVQGLSGSRLVLFDTWQGQQRVHRIETLKFADTILTLGLLGNAALLVAHLEGRWEVVPGVGAFWAAHLGLSGPLPVGKAALILASCYALPKGLTLLGAWAWSLKDKVRLGPWDRDLARSYLRFAVPLMVMGAISLVLQYTDSLVLGFFWTAREVGLYGGSQKLSSVCLIGATAVGTVLFPRFAQLHARGDRVKEEATFAQSQRYLLAFAAPLAAALVALPREALHVAVGDQYLDAAGPLRVLALWSLVVALEMPLSSRLMGTGQTSMLMRAGALNAGGNVLLNLVLVPPQALGLGPSGAALATLLSTSAAYVYLVARSRRHHPMPLLTSHQARILLAGAVAWAVWAAARHLAGPAAFDRVWELGAWGLAGAAAYLGALLAMREIQPEDRAFLHKAAHPKALLDELRGRGG
jgi:O-antigen/teichoic acid export membrane protein